jgi:hypothetical protein
MYCRGGFWPLGNFAYGDQWIMQRSHPSWRRMPTWSSCGRLQIDEAWDSCTICKNSGRLALLYDLLKSCSDSQVSGGMCPKWVPKNLCAVIWGSGKDVQWSPKVGVTLKVADWHIPLAQSPVPQGFWEGILSWGCPIWSAKCVWAQFSLT